MTASHLARYVYKVTYVGLLQNLPRQHVSTASFAHYISIHKRHLSSNDNGASRIVRSRSSLWKPDNIPKEFKLAYVKKAVNDTKIAALAYVWHINLAVIILVAVMVCKAWMAEIMLGEESTDKNEPFKITSANLVLNTFAVACAATFLFLVYRKFIKSNIVRMYCHIQSKTFVMVQVKNGLAKENIPFTAKHVHLVKEVVPTKAGESKYMILQIMGHELKVNEKEFTDEQYYHILKGK